MHHYLWSACPGSSSTRNRKDSEGFPFVEKGGVEEEPFGEPRCSFESKEGTMFGNGKLGSQEQGSFRKIIVRLS